MPFRSNFFGDKIAQPGTEMGEIDDLLTTKYGDVPTIYAASLESDGDSEFKFGGRIAFNALEDDEDTYIEDLNFDGFDSLDDARQWLIDEIGVGENDIEVDS